ncbi:MAG: hypothetical protein LBQ52_05735 [Helicobacteraceae bacterium]|jgi:hypothetical protein|nr:hypothetical protein [Helicobacteraceae bacterium]
MIAVIENRDFIEGIFAAKEEASEYLARHIAKENCALKETAFEKFPFYTLEIGRGKFKYVNSAYEVIKFAFDADTKGLDPDFCLFNIYRVSEPFLSRRMNGDAMGLLNHRHIEKAYLDDFFKREKKLRRLLQSGFYIKSGFARKCFLRFYR